MNTLNTVTLRRILLLDAATCVVTGLLLAAAPLALSNLLGLSPALLFYAGLSLFPCAALMFWAAMSEPLQRPLAQVIVAGNVAWVAGSVLVLFMASPTTVGYAFVIAQAVAVLALADFEWLGLRRAS